MSRGHVRLPGRPCRGCRERLGLEDYGQGFGVHWGHREAVDRPAVQYTQGVGMLNARRREVGLGHHWRCSCQLSAFEGLPPLEKSSSAAMDCCSEETKNWWDILIRRMPLWIAGIIGPKLPTLVAMLESSGLGWPE